MTRSGWTIVIGVMTAALILLVVQSRIFVPDTPNDPALDSKPEIVVADGMSSTQTSQEMPTPVTPTMPSLSTIQPDEKTSSASPEKLAWSDLDQYQDLHAGLAAARGRLGTTNADYRSMYLTVAEACSYSANQTARYRVTEAPAGVKWVLAALELRCKNVIADQTLVPAADASSLLREYLQGDAGKAALAAEQVIGSSTSAMQLVEAMEVMRNAETFPNFTALEPLPAEARYKSTMYAAMLRECEVSRQCGPNGLTTLTFCLHEGCREGVNFETAMRDASSQRAVEATMQVYRWLQSQRR